MRFVGVFETSKNILRIYLTAFSHLSKNVAVNLVGTKFVMNGFMCTYTGLYSSYYTLGYCEPNMFASA